MIQTLCARLRNVAEYCIILIRFGSPSGGLIFCNYIALRAATSLIVCADVAGRVHLVRFDLYWRARISMDLIITVIICSGPRAGKPAGHCGSLFARPTMRLGRRFLRGLSLISNQSIAAAARAIQLNCCFRPSLAMARSGPYLKGHRHTHAQCFHRFCSGLGNPAPKERPPLCFCALRQRFGSDEALII